MNEKPRRILIYKRTHTADPDTRGCFGIYLCMGRVRAREFDAVIGVGGRGPEAVENGIDRKITWMGIGPHEIGTADDGYPLLAFEQFYLKDENGLRLSEKAPKLARRLFAEYGPRVVMADVDKEIAAVLRLARNSPPSAALFDKIPRQERCTPSKKKKKKRC